MAQTRNLTREKNVTGELTGRRRGKRQNKVVMILLFTIGVVILIAVTAMLSGSLRFSDRLLIYHTVRRGDLQITVTERGNLQSQDEIKIICEVDDIDGDGIHGTPILWVIPNGSSVKKGEPLVELDSSNHQERLDQQILDTEKARAEQIQARVKHENQKTQNQTNWEEAKLQVDVAELAKEQYLDKEGGTFQIELQNVELQIQEAQAQQLIEQTNLAGIERLHKLGYRSSGELAEARLRALQAEGRLATAISTKKELVEYRYPKTKMQLEGQSASAKRALQQVQRDNEALLEQAKAAMEAADEALKKEEELLARYKKDVEKSKIYSPQDGMVAYATERSHWYRREIRAGAAVRPQQTILTLPNLKKMKVTTAVHESVLDQIKIGLPATITVDAFPDRSYKGTVRSVAVLPDQDSWMSSDTKVYETVVTIDEEVSRLKPGMTAVVQIHVDRLENVLAIPVQAIVQIEDETWCYVDARPNVERRMIELGGTNDKFVEITEGLKEGDRVVLNPMAIVDESKEGVSETSSGEDLSEPAKDDPERQIAPEDSRSQLQESTELSPGDKVSPPILRESPES
jgi:RND family efflux transporter MFP subunit